LPDPKRGFERQWNLGKLFGSHENAHIAFTLSAQAVMGAFVLLVPGAFVAEPMAGLRASAAALPTLIAMAILMGFGLAKLNLHLGKPHRFYRGFYNLRLSPVSREIAGVSAFFAGLLGYTLLAPFEGAAFVLLRGLCAVLALAGGGFGGYYMYKLYRIPARPFWDHWHTAAAFAGTALSLGGLLLALGALALGVLTPALSVLLATAIALGLALEAAGLISHARDLANAESGGAASFYAQVTRYGYPYWVRNAVLAGALLLALGLATTGSTSAGAFALLASIALVSSLIGRALFLALVIPTTMPNAFVWKNAGFIEHAREIGLADMPQLGVVLEHHHPFRLDELIETIRTTSLKDRFVQFRRILTG